MGKLFVMLFARPADTGRTGMTLSHLQGLATNPAFGLAQLHTIKILHHDKFPAPRQFVPRHCASALSELCLPRLYPIRLSNLYRDPTFAKASAGEDGKNACHTCLATGTTFRPRVLGVPGPVAGWLRQVTQAPHIAGPLAVRQSEAKSSLYQDFRRSSRSFAARPCNRPVAAKHILFCLPGLGHLDNFIIS
jgi:hypothetical protein